MKKTILILALSLFVAADAHAFFGCRYFAPGWYRYNRVTGTMSSRGVAARLQCGVRRPGTWVYFSGGSLCRGRVVPLRNGRQRYSCRIDSVWSSR